MKAVEQVRVERAVYGGSGLARLGSGVVVFVPFTLPDELVDIEVPQTGNEAMLLRVIEPSPSRVAPPCPHFGRCGGCQYQHAEYPAQLAIKQAILLETMERAGIQQLPPLTSHSSEPWAYRNRVRFRIEQVAGEQRFGYNVRATNEFLPIAVCPITSPWLLRAAEALLAVASASAEARSWLEAAKEVEFFSSSGGDQINMTMFMVTTGNRNKNSFDRVCETLKARLPELTGASAQLAAAATTQAHPAIASWGAAGLTYRAAGENYWISHGGFFQVNRFLIDKLVELVCQERSGALAWDLYAGVGLFSRVLARSFSAVTVVEANPVAVADLRAALARIGPQYSAVQATTLAYLRGAVLQRERPELIVLDPPRAGAGLEACHLLLQLRPREMVYVSCDPTTLARDLAVLQQGYRVTAMHLVDLFPQTFHMETVVVLERSEVAK